MRTEKVYEGISTFSLMTRTDKYRRKTTHMVRNGRVTTIYFNRLYTAQRHINLFHESAFTVTSPILTPIHQNRAEFSPYMNLDYLSKVQCTEDNLFTRKSIYSCKSDFLKRFWVIKYYRVDFICIML